MRMHVEETVIETRTLEPMEGRTVLETVSSQRVKHRSKKEVCDDFEAAYASPAVLSVSQRMLGRTDDMPLEVRQEFLDDTGEWRLLADQIWQPGKPVDRYQRFCQIDGKSIDIFVPSWRVRTILTAVRALEPMPEDGKEIAVITRQSIGPIPGDH